VYLAYHIATAPPLGAGSDAAAAPTIGVGLLLGVANPLAPARTSLAPILRDPARSGRANLALAAALIVSTAVALLH
jgi:hypothetical protein